MAGEAENMDQAGNRGRKVKDGQSVRCLGLDAAPGPCDSHAAHLWKQVGRSLRRPCQIHDVDPALFLVEVGTPLLTAADQYCAGSRLLERQRSPYRTHHRGHELRQALGDDHHRGTGAKREIVACDCRKPPRPSPGGVDHQRCAVAAAIADDDPVVGLPFQSDDGFAFFDFHPGCPGSCTKGMGGAIGVGRAIAGDQHGADAML